MLPHELADDLCSLRPHADRLCVTVELPHDGAEPSFYRSVIRSDARLSYGQAEQILAGKEQFEHVETLRRLDERARELRRARFARGALRIQTPEIVFEFDGSGGVADARRQGEPDAHALVEEFMIRANEAVAELLASRNRPALYRVHERPEPQSILLLLGKLAELEIPTPPAPDELAPSQAAAIAARAAERIETYVAQSGRGRDAFPALILRSLKQARYDPRNLGHAGLASRAYCHFTSPIRRYPDLVCHRALLAEIGAADAAPPDDLGELAEHTSVREREAAQIEYQADEICLAWLLDSRLYEQGWETTFDGRDRRRDRLRPLRPLRRRLRGIPARTPACRATTSRRRRSAPRSPAGAAAGRCDSATRSRCASSASNATPAGSKSHPANVGAMAVKVIAENRKARHEYHLLERYEAGLVLTGTEVKSMRDGGATLQQAYADIRNGEAWLIGAHIAEYGQGNVNNHEPDRDRKLLLHRKEIASLYGKVRERGLTLVPTRLYFKDGKVKVEVALARGKEQRDKRRDIAKRDAARQIERELKSSGRSRSSA